MKRTAFVALAALTLTAPGAQAQTPQTFTYSVSAYGSPSFVDVYGGFSFISRGITSKPVTLTPGVAANILLDNGAQDDIAGAGPASIPPQVFTGTATSRFSLYRGGVLAATKLFSLDYTLDGTHAYARPGVYSTGTPFVLNLGAGQTLTLTPKNDSYGERAATALLFVPSAPVPEFSSAAGFGLLLLAGALVLNAKKRTA